MSISDQSLEEIKARIEIEEVVSDFLSLKRKGQNLWACCPFHDEKTPSFSVSPAKGIFKCFGCGKAGDAIEFVKEIEGLDYLEAMKFLGKKYGVELEEEPPTPEDLARQSQRESLFIVLNFAKEYFQKLLWEHEQGRAIGLSYFKERGYPEKVIKIFELGYSLEAWDALRKAALEQGYQQKLLVEAGLVVEKEEKAYDRFRGRVIFPIHNITGKVIAFGARTLNSQKGPKYLNSPETDVYQKSKVLYGLYQGRTAIRQEDNCYLVEGYTDVISMHLSGVPNVVASSGTSLTEDQIKLIKRYTNNITVLFDGDTAGIKASLRGIDMILSSGANVRVVEFPQGEDPDSYATKLGTTEFKDFLNYQVADFITYKTQLFLREAHDDPFKRVQTIKEVVLSISKIPDPLQRAVYMKKCSGLLDIDESLLIGELNKLQLKTSRQGVPPPTLRTEDLTELTKERISRNPNDAITHQESESIRLLLNYGNSKLDDDMFLHQYFFQELADVEFKTPKYQTILELLHTCVKEQGRVDAQILLERSQGAVKLEIINLLSDKYEISSQWMDKFQIYVPQEKEILSDVAYSNLLRLKYRVIKKLIDENRAELKQVEAQDQQQKLLQVDFELKKSRNELAKLLGIVVSD
ncbi:MAG: DNA primase [Cyclobacteriaceae bacterium]|nr:DNA primase [Cyclobacteriaceae bacterium]